MSTAPKLKGQRAGSQFEAACAEFLKQSFLGMPVLPAGVWQVEHVHGLSNAAFFARFAQYAHIGKLAKTVEKNRELEAVLSNAYSIAPDVVIYRRPYTEDALFSGPNPKGPAGYSSMRLRNQALPILHAVISCKWTLRSDRAQNARSEALNLIRNRKGRAPHMAVVTGEPTPGRIASLALGTGDVDMVYHFALPELKAEVEENGSSSEKDLLATLIGGSRLRDIADLPLDLLA